MAHGARSSANAPRAAASRPAMTTQEQQWPACRSNNGGPRPVGFAGRRLRRQTAVAASVRRRAAAGRGAAAGPGGRSAGGPGGPGGMRPLPDLDQLIARLQAYVRRSAAAAAAAPRGRFTGGRGLALIGLGCRRACGSPAASIACSRTSRAWCCASAPSTAPTPPGLNYHLPWPIETVDAAGRHPHQPHRDRLSLRRRRRSKPAARAVATCWKRA